MGGPCDRRAQTVRRYAAVLLLVAVACVATPGTGIAQASPKAIRFAPPLDRTLVYRVVQYVGTGKTQRRFESVRHLRFAPDGGGYRLTVTLRDVTGEGPRPAMARYRAALAPLIGVTQQMRIDRNGRIIAIDNMPDVWAAFMQGQRALLTASGGNAATRTAIDHIASLDAADRLATFSHSCSLPLAQHCRRCAVGTRAIPALSFSASRMKPTASPLATRCNRPPALF